jgi:hypothetical protein
MLRAGTASKTRAMLRGSISQKQGSACLAKITSTQVENNVFRTLAMQQLKSEISAANAKLARVTPILMQRRRPVSLTLVIVPQRS